MNVKQAFKMAVKSIVSKKMRSFLTMLGIIIGVAAVVIMVSALQGQNKKTMEYIESQGTNKLEVSAYSYAGKNVSQELYDYCLGLGDLVQGVTPNGQIYSEVVVKFGSKTISTQNYDDWENTPTIYLGSDQYGLCNNYTIAAGREMSHLDIEKENNVCVLGGRVAENLFDFVNPVGQTITLNGSPFTVVGVYERKDVDNWPEMDNIIVLPYTLSRTMNDNQPIENYSVKAVDATSASQAKVWIEGFLQGLIGENGYYYVQNYNPAGGRHRHHEHHAGHRHRAHPGDRHPQGHRRRAPQHHRPVPHRGVHALRHRRHPGHLHRLPGDADRGQAAAEHDPISQHAHHRGCVRVLGGPGHRLRPVPRHQGLRPPAGERPAGGVVRGTPPGDGCDTLYYIRRTCV